MDLILVVLYKQTVFESTTLKTLLNCKDQTSDKHLFVWDNSPIALEQTEILFLKEFYTKFTYFHSKDNTSLSKVYNTVIRNVDFEKIYIFDQDTTITGSYFERMDDAALIFLDVGVFLPFVKFNDKILSPLFYKAINFNHAYHITKGRTLAKNRTAFASGLCINEWVFKKKNIWFDEELKFYGIDYKFMLDYGDSIKFMCVIDYELHHSLSFTEEEAKEIKIRRFDSSILSSFYLARTRFNIFEKTILVARTFISSFKMVIKFRSMIFFNIFFRNLHLIFYKNNY